VLKKDDLDDISVRFLIEFSQKYNSFILSKKEIILIEFPLRTISGIYLVERDISANFSADSFITLSLNSEDLNKTLVLIS
jgi:hypothetical protein